MCTHGAWGPEFLSKCWTLSCTIMNTRLALGAFLCLGFIEDAFSLKMAEW